MAPRGDQRLINEIRARVDTIHCGVDPDVLFDEREGYRSRGDFLFAEPHRIVETVRRELMPGETVLTMGTYSRPQRFPLPYAGQDLSAPADLELHADPGEDLMPIAYLEIVTSDVDAVCAAYAAANGFRFGDPDAGLGYARTAKLPGGGMVGVRAPLHETEQPVVRPYWLVDDIDSALAAAVAAGAEVAHPPLEIPGHGTFAIHIAGGVQHGLWQR